MTNGPVRQKSPLLVVIPVLLMLVPLGYTLITTLGAREVTPAGTFLERPDPRHEKCVRETTYMRLHHWELLTELREEVVREGKRGPVSLNECRGCHTSRERFCNRCHNAVNVNLMCFGCHYYP
ncbi:MAG: hypothetical protein V2A76_08825 [Planctomycetota bacterium]